MSTQIPDDNSITSATFEDKLYELQSSHEDLIRELQDKLYDAKETHEDRLRDLQSQHEQQRLWGLQVVYAELDTVKATLSYISGLLLRVRNQMSKFDNSTQPPLSISTTPHTLGPLPWFGLRPPSSPPDPTPPPLATVRTSNPRFFNPVPYSTTIQIIEMNYHLHQEYLHCRVNESDSNLEIVF